MSAQSRRRVMSPQTRAALGLTEAPLGSDPGTPTARRTGPPAESSATDLAALAVLMRVQRNLAVRSCATLFGLLVGLPVAAALVPGLATVRLGPIPGGWLVLGVAIYPALLLLAARHRRSVDHLEVALDERAGREHP